MPIRQIAERDAALLASLAAEQPQPQAALPIARCPQPPKNHEPRFDLRTPLHQLTGGTDLSQIDSIGPHAALQLIAEIGTDMSGWKTEQHFTYKDPDAVRYYPINRTREIKSLRKRAKLAGLELLDAASGEVLNPVS